MKIWLIIVCVSWVCIGCDRNVVPHDEHGDGDGLRSKGKEKIDASIQKVFGEYIVTDYTSYRGSLDPESWIKKQVGRPVVISEKIYYVLGRVTLYPKYAIKRYEELEEGVVAMGERRLLSDFHGFDSGGNGVTRITTREPNDQYDFVPFEVRDEDVLWMACSGWLLQLQRVGSLRKITPLRELEAFYQPPKTGEDKVRIPQKPNPEGIRPVFP